MGLEQIILEAGVDIISMIKERHAAANPTLAPLTDAEVVAALHNWTKTTVAVDDTILKAHGEQ